MLSKTIDYNEWINEPDLVIKDRYIYPSISKTNYFLTTSAITLVHCKISVKSSFLIYNSIQIALLKNIDIGFSTVLGTIGYQEIIYNYRLSPHIDNTMIPMMYFGFQKTW
jgi:hypothetical protein